MGKPSQSTASPDAFSLHDAQPNERYHDSDDDAPDLAGFSQDDDLPPVYDEAIASGSSSANAPLLIDGPSSQAAPGLLALTPFRHDDATSYYLDNRLDADPARLEQYVRAWAAVPPRPHIQIRGTHTSHNRDRNGKKESKEVVDFDVHVDLTPYLLPGGRSSKAHYEVRTVENIEKVRRGGVCRKRAHRLPGAARLELGLADTDAQKPSLTEWCHRYYASHSGLKTFQLKRQVVGLDQGRLKEHLHGLVRRTNYRGSVRIQFPVRDEKVELWNDCRVNRWRLTQWVIVLFYVTCLWVITWPVLFFMTKKFETVSAVWPYSTVDGEGNKKYVTLSEDQWYNLWGRAISKAVLSKRRGTLDQQDLLEAEGAPQDLNSGSDLIRAGINAMNAANRQLGWGHSDF